MSAAKDKGSHVKRLALLKPLRWRLLAGLAAMTVTIAIQLAYPKALAYFIDHLDQAQAPGWFGTFALAMAALLLVQAGATAMRYYLFDSSGLMLVARVRELVHQALLRQGIAFYDSHNVGELTNRLSADVEELQDTFTMGMAISLRSVLVCLGGVALLIATSPLLSLAMLPFIPISLYLGKKVGGQIERRSARIQACQADCGKVAHENLANIRLIHAFNRQARAQHNYQGATAAALAESLSRTRYLAGFQGYSSLLIYLVLVFTLWLGARLIAQQALTVGELTSFVLYSAMVTASAGAISSFWSDWMRAIGATRRVFEILDSAPTEQPGRNAGTASPLAFEAVDFHYPGRPEKAALQNFNLALAEGEKVALVGPSGAGKSTVAALLLGFYPPTSGSLRFGGQDSRTLDWPSLRQGIAVVEQEPALFSGSIRDNIAFGARDEAPDDQAIIQAARLANAHDFISQFPAGYQTQVGDRGVQLSGGQKQRIAIARAILRDPKLLILDEATSALDGASEMLVQGALDNLMAGRTTLIIAHRYATIIKADRVLVLEGGRLVQQGSHQELAADRAGLYARLFGEQLAGQRLQREKRA
ncbi:ABC transporter transmembrane domain-containing protein [Gallaecimonas kandeliae]|uniref:ABC transporter ATP-binding protein n=1 Tax=Gallaecimonas kandeliae TaxID=3029055 RepID=UPI002649070D|nr:ABC transporter transmembrane domain-containing protein [Gallaecimonas kandeliae]WKE64858.1 ABC transporter transmembrane domain-containing protein [Gallaecimonas kandeliae]